MKKVLVVDDNPVNRKLATTLLKRRGMQVEEADNGRLALDMLNAGAYDAVLLDISMPGMDGKEVCRTIRNTPVLATLQVVAYTAHGTTAERKDIMSAGFDDMVVKPISGQDLRRVLPD